MATTGRVGQDAAERVKVRVYSQLVDTKGKPASEIAKSIGIPQPKVERVLQGFVQKRYARTEFGNLLGDRTARTYFALGPAVPSFVTSERTVVVRRSGGAFRPRGLGPGEPGKGRKLPGRNRKVP